MTDKLATFLKVLSHAVPVFIAVGVGIFVIHSLNKTDEVTQRIDSYMQQNDKNYQAHVKDWEAKKAALARAEARKAIIIGLDR